MIEIKIEIEIERERERERELCTSLLRFWAYGAFTSDYIMDCFVCDPSPFQEDSREYWIIKYSVSWANQNAVFPGLSRETHSTASNKTISLHHEKITTRLITIGKDRNSITT